MHPQESHYSCVYSLCATTRILDMFNITSDELLIFHPDSVLSMPCWFPWFQCLLAKGLFTQKHLYCDTRYYSFANLSSLFLSHTHEYTHKHFLGLNHVLSVLMNSAVSPSTFFLALLHSPSPLPSFYISISNRKSRNQTRLHTKATHASLSLPAFGDSSVTAYRRRTGEEDRKARVKGRARHRRVNIASCSMHYGSYRYTRRHAVLHVAKVLS